MKTLLIFFLLYATSASAWEFQPATLDHLSLDVARYSCNREPMTPEIACDQYKGMTRLNWNVGLLNDVVKWRNEITGTGTYAKFETYEWHYMVTIPLPGGLEPFIEHRSRHTLDQTQPTLQGQTQSERFPVADSYGLRITFYEREKH